MSLSKICLHWSAGVEVYYPYPRHRAFVKFFTAKKVEQIADKYNLIKTGGTDEHGNL